MPECQGAPPDSPADLVRAVRGRLGDLDPTLEPVADGILGEAGRIDLLARDGRGRAVLVLIDGGGTDAALFTRALAHRAWVAARIGDWLKLAPDLGLAPEAPPGCWLLSPDFSVETRAAQRALDDPQIQLARYAWRAHGETLALWLQPCSGLSPQADLPLPPSASPAPKAAAFRSGLIESDFALSDAEIRSLQAGSEV